MIPSLSRLMDSTTLADRPNDTPTSVTRINIGAPRLLGNPDSFNVVVEKIKQGMSWHGFYSQLFEGGNMAVSTIPTPNLATSPGDSSVYPELSKELRALSAEHPNNHVFYHKWLALTFPSGLVPDLRVNAILKEDLNRRIQWIDQNIVLNFVKPLGLPPGWLWYERSTPKGMQLVYIGPRSNQLMFEEVTAATSVAMAWSAYLNVSDDNPHYVTGSGWDNVRAMLKNIESPFSKALREKQKRHFDRALKIEAIRVKRDEFILQKFGYKPNNSDPKYADIQRLADAHFEELLKEAKVNLRSVPEIREREEQAQKLRKLDADERKLKLQEKKVVMDAEKDKRKQLRMKAQAARADTNELSNNQFIKRVVSNLIDGLITKVERVYAKGDAQQRRARALEVKAGILMQSDEQDTVKRLAAMCASKAVSGVLRRARNRDNYRKREAAKQLALQQERLNIQIMLDALEEEGDDAMSANMNSDLPTETLLQIMENVKARLVAAKDSASNEELRERIELEFQATLNAFNLFIANKQLRECRIAQKLAFEKRAAEDILKGSIIDDAVQAFLGVFPPDSELDVQVKELESGGLTLRFIKWFAGVLQSSFTCDKDALYSWNSFVVFVREQFAPQVNAGFIDAVSVDKLLLFVNEIVNGDDQTHQMCVEFERRLEMYQSDGMDVDEEDGEEGEDLNEEDGEEDDNTNSDDEYADNFIDDSDLVEGAEADAASLLMQQLTGVMQNAARTITALPLGLERSQIEDLFGVSGALETEVETNRLKEQLKRVQQSTKRENTSGFDNTTKKQAKRIVPMKISSTLLIVRPGTQLWGFARACLPPQAPDEAISSFLHTIRF
jgi:hypothetical protein